MQQRARTAIALTGLLLIVFSPMALEIHGGIDHFRQRAPRTPFATRLAWPAGAAAAGVLLVVAAHTDRRSPALAVKRRRTCLDR